MKIEQLLRKNISQTACVCLLALMLMHSSLHAQYLHRSGKQVVNGQGQEVILRGMGLGGWMLQEGYMLETNSFANPQHQIRARIEDLVGEQNTNTFYDAWLANHCTKRDIDSLASWGFNSVRLPMHYNLFTLPIEKEPVAGQNTWLDKGFTLTDNLLQWCAANHIYLILDLHATPGGQGNDAAISDYDNTKPSLWQSEANKQKTIVLWKKLAERYANEPWIGGYDLINETNWPFTGNNKNGCDETSNAPLRQMLVDITTAIRQVDPNHIIFIEGNCWANNYNGIFPLWDNNMVVSFHKYWNNNDQGSLQGFINFRDQHNVPLWLGESGENSNTWFTNAIALMERNKIGWAWWPMKKVGSVVNPLTVVRNPGYDQLLSYWKNGGPKPAAATAQSALMQLAENLKIENCIYRKDVIDAMFRQVQQNTTLPFKPLVAPGVVHTADYDLGRVNKAYHDTDTATYHVSGGSYTAWNSGWSYRNDGVDIQTNTDTDPKGNGHNIGWTAKGEWTQYTMKVDSTAAYNINIRYAAQINGSRIKLSVDGADKTPITELPATGGNEQWSNKTVNDVVLYKGSRKLRLFFEQGGANISYLEFVLSKKASAVPTRAVGASTAPDGERIRLSLNKNIAPATLTTSGFTVTVDGTTITTTAVAADTQDNTQLLITVGQPLTDRDYIRINYNGTTLAGADGTTLAGFTDLPVANTLPRHIAIPGKLEAEDFAVNQGLQLETTTDAGGGQNIAYTNAGDYLEYRVKVEETKTYDVELRVASAGQAGKIEIQQLDRTQQVLHTTTADVPVTGGWQTWQTITSTLTLAAGSTILRLKVLQPEFNLNWLRFTTRVVSGVTKKNVGMLQLYPNPTDTLLNVALPESYGAGSTLSIFNAGGTLVRYHHIYNTTALQQLDVGDLQAGPYIIKLHANGNVWSRTFIVQ